MQNLYEKAFVTENAKSKIRQIFGEDADIAELLGKSFPENSNCPFSYKIAENEKEATVYCEKNHFQDKQPIAIVSVSEVSGFAKLTDFAYLKDIKTFLRDIASLALPECWTDKNLNSSGEYNLLQSYIFTTFSFIFTSKSEFCSQLAIIKR